MKGQFRALVSHFFGRFFDVDSVSADADSRGRVIQLLALLTVPGAMISFFMLSDHPPGVTTFSSAAFTYAERLWLRVGDRYVFVAYAMVVMGLLMTFKWDSLFPDRRDYLVLTSLPISPRRWFAAKVLALCAFLSLFVVAINVFSLLLVPRLVAEQSGVRSATVFWEAFTAHAAGTIGGAIFAALFFAALQGILINILTPEAFRRISPRVQMISIAVLVTLLLVIPLVKDSIPTLAQNDSPLLDYFPFMWFLGLYEALIPGGSMMPRSIVWTHTAFNATAIVTILFALSYFIGYRRYSRKILESVESDTLILRWWKKAADSILDRTLLRQPLQRATFHFIEKISSRSGKHRILTALYLGIGIALAISSLFAIDPGSASALPFRLSARGALEAPVILAFVLISGLRATFNVPSELNANWMFRIAGDSNSPHFLKAVRKWIFLYRIVPLFSLVALFEFRSFKASTAVYHLTFDLILAAFLIAVFFARFNKVPFTCSYSTNKMQLAAAATAYLFGFTIYVQIATGLKRAVTQSPARLFVFLAISGLIFAVIRRRRDRRKTIIYKDDGPGFLSLTDDSGYWTQNSYSPPKLGGVPARTKSETGGVVPKPHRFSWTSHYHVILQDVRYALRMMRKNPGFTAVAVVSLALGIGGNTAVFTVVNAVFLKTFPVRDISTLYSIGTIDTINPKGVPHQPMSWLNYQDMRRENQVFSDVAAASFIDASSKSATTESRLSGAIVSASYFDVLGVKPAFGRVFNPKEDESVLGNPVVILSHQLWTDRFGSSRNIAGKQIILNSRQFSVIGVLPEEFKGLRIMGKGDQFWIPFSETDALLLGRVANRRDLAWGAIARLKRGVSASQAAAEIRTIGERLEKDYPVDNAGRSLRIEKLTDYLRGTTTGSPIVALAALTMTGVGIILVIACINLASLSLARSAYRQREVGIRIALGGSRFRILRQLLTENVVLALAGGGLGFLGARWLRDVLWSLRPSNFTIDSLELPLDFRVMAFTLLVSVAAGLVVGLMPALHASRASVNRTLHGSEAARLASGWSRSRLRSMLLMTEVSLAVVSLVCAGLFFRVLQKATTIDMGFDWSKMADAAVDLKAAGYSPAQGQQFYRDAIERAASIPGIEAAAAQSARFAFSGAFYTADGEHTPGYRPAPTFNVSISTNYFSVLGVPVIAGRALNNDDQLGAPPVAVISQSTADYFWPAQNPIGKRFHFYRETIMREVVGLVPTTGWWVTRTPPLEVYLPMRQVYDPVGAIRIRSSRLSPALLSQLRTAMQALDPRVPITDIHTMRDDLYDSMRPFRIITTALTTAGLIALAIALIGIYGVMAYSVAQRTQELGIRLALGAQRIDLLGLIVSQAIGITGIGIVAGLLMARAFTPVFARLLPLQVQPGDPVAFFGAAGVVFAISLIASLGPARRATRVDPLVALRYE